MPLVAGQSLSFYEILGPLGAGGMGEVYRAKDTRLEREVAIKVLPEEMAQDEERLRRFEREAKTLASLNHPNVAGIHGVDQEGDVCFLALELVPGEDLAARLSRGPLAVDEALDVCSQIAEGLEAAHEAGVVHRDLKPANVRITPDGIVKILDFGLAKPMHSKKSGDSSSGAAQPDSFAMTEEGMVLGTPTYMSPEQARGKPVDRRTDIWAFGCVLFECLTGERAFGGSAVAEILAAVIERGWDQSALPVDTPPHVRALLGRCLDKDPRSRLRDIGEARVRLGELRSLFEQEGSDDARLLPVASRSPAWFPWAIAVAAATVSLVGARFLWSGAEDATPSRQVRFTIRHPATIPTVVLNPVVAPDGSYVAYVAVEGNVASLWIRELDAAEPRPLPGTEGASRPFASPDGRFLGFYADNKLKKVAVTGGTPVEISDITDNPGASWTADGTIVYSRRWTSGLVRIPAEGGPVEEVTRLDAEAGETGHWWPTPLPDGHGLLYTVFTTDGTLNRARIELLDGTTGQARFVADGAQPIPLASGELLYHRAGVYELAPFDAESGMITGPARTVLEELPPLGPQGTRERFLSISKTGVMAYVTRNNDVASAPRSWFWLDPSGVLVPLALPLETRSYPRLSPDGKRLAIVRAVAGEFDVFVHDLESGTETRITTKSINQTPAWSPDGERLLFESVRLGRYGIFEADPKGGREAQPLFTPEGDVFLGGITADGKTLIVEISGDEAGADVVLVTLESGELKPLVVTPGNEKDPTLSPDGRLVAYSTNVSGTRHVYVVPLSGESAPVKVSRGGGVRPQWTAGGSKLAFHDGAQVLLADISSKGGLVHAGRPAPFVTDGLPDDYSRRFTGDYTITPDGDKLILSLLDERARAEIEVVIDGFEALGVR